MKMTRTTTTNTNSLFHILFLSLSLSSFLIFANIHFLTPLEYCPQKRERERERERERKRVKMGEMGERENRKLERLERSFTLLKCFRGERKAFWNTDSCAK